ncbi:fatty acid--CoA ligase [Chelatococcus reniformis]|uniref:Fatty acid--CoA ligase n=2 Tax=Chelatococcus reniformis TaxID=1494448 RepID=A0A916XEU5_9HYPH|nr:fatty acid--CoA ligase [Chelatococcus reniformis]
MLTAPGAPYEVDEAVIRGLRTHVWKNAAPHLRHFLDASRAHGDADYIVYEDERLTYAAHFRACAKFAHALASRFGVRKGDRVALAMRNYPEWSVAFWSAAAIGAVVVPLNAWMSGPELEYCLADSGSAVLVADGERLARIAPHLGGLALRGLVVTRAEGPLPDGALPWVDLVAADQDLELPPVRLAPDDDATIFYTSGTTGKPKGALGTHRNICTNQWTVAYNRAKTALVAGVPLPDPATAPKRAFLLPVPLFHVTGCHSGMLPTFAAGNKLVLMYRWDPARGMQLIEREKVSGFTGVPAIAWQILEHPDFDRYDLSSLENVSYGGAPASPELLRRVRSTFPAAFAGNGYGLTETSSVVAQNQGPEYVERPDSVGPAIPVCDIRVVDPDGRDLPPGGIGELWVKGPNVVKGYWNKPEETAKSFTEGWLHTGDVVRCDDDGYIYILDRAKDMLIRGGENIYCTEVEDALYSHPAVMDAAVVGIPHRVLGEEVGAVVQVKPGFELDEDGLKQHVAGRLAAFKVPVRIDIRREPLPRNANGKIVKRDLRNLFVS